VAAGGDCIELICGKRKVPAPHFKKYHLKQHMVFSSITFLFYFLPGVLLLYWLVGKRMQNLLLLLASLLFYAWGEGVYLLLMLTSISINFVSGQLIHAFRASPLGKFFCIVGIILNLGLLGYYKYGSFITENLNVVLDFIGLPMILLDPVRLPIGISFFTFQALSYIIDVYRQQNEPQKNFINLGLYIALFPQLIAGPIVRYHDIAAQLANRRVTREGFAYGVQRFLFGLSKKVLLANTMAVVADKIFALPVIELTPSVAWLGIFCFILQLYYDFSGYSDMAIGLGRMFGFHFLENFNYPYISRSLSEFWIRWHISLGTWIRDYVYFPLGGSRLGERRTQINLFIVFFLCGLWHGASWNMAIWGVYNGVVVLIERTRFSDYRRKLWYPLQIISFLLIFMFGMVIFCTPTLAAAKHYFLVMIGLISEPAAVHSASFYLNSKVLFEIAVAVVFSLPVYPALGRLRAQISERLTGRRLSIFYISVEVSRLVITLSLVYFTCISLASGVYNPFIYFRF
jgi:alginate O-acetyltransferase complex protein AlgI